MVGVPCLLWGQFVCRFWSSSHPCSFPSIHPSNQADSIYLQSPYYESDTALVLGDIVGNNTKFLLLWRDTIYLHKHIYIECKPRLPILMFIHPNFLEQSSKGLAFLVVRWVTVYSWDSKGHLGFSPVFQASSIKSRTQYTLRESVFNDSNLLSSWTCIMSYCRCYFFAPE